MAMTTPLSSPRDRDEALRRFQALADENRLRILEALCPGECCVCDLQDGLGLSQSLLSHHLKTLKEAGLVHARREGRWVHYSICTDALAQVAGVTRDLARTCRRTGPSGGCC